MKDERVYLLHALEAIDAVLSYTEDGRGGGSSRTARRRTPSSYFGVDLNLVWDVVERDLPAVRSQLAALSKRLDKDAGSGS